MSSWVDRFNKHELWTTLEELRAVLKPIAAPEDGNERDSLEWAHAITERVGVTKQRVDPFGVTPGMLTKTEATLRVLHDAVVAWQDETTDWKPVDAAINGVTESLAVWPPLEPDASATAVSASLSKISSATDGAFDKLNESTATLAASLEKLATAQAKLDSDAKALDTSNAKKLAELASVWEVAQQKHSDEAGMVLAGLKKLRTEAETMVHESTALMVGTEYASHAAKRRKSAFVYDSLAVLFGVLGLGSLFYYLHEVGGSDTSVGLAVTRLGITTGALVIGGLLAARGAEQHRESRELQRTALALSRMAPFVANLPEDARQILTIETADRIFTRGELGSVSERDSVLERLQQVRKQRAASAAASEDV